MLSSKFLWSKITLGLENKDNPIPPGRTMGLFPDPCYISQCLTNAHGYPLDITICIDEMVSPERCEDTLPTLLQGMTLVHTHAIRWRSLHCKAPLWFFELDDINDIINGNLFPQLETMSLIVYDSVDPKDDPLLEGAVSESVRHLHLD